MTRTLMIQMRTRQTCLHDLNPSTPVDRQASTLVDECRILRYVRLRRIESIVVDPDEMLLDHRGDQTTETDLQCVVTGFDHDARLDHRGHRGHHDKSFPCHHEVADCSLV